MSTFFGTSVPRNTSLFRPGIFGEYARSYADYVNDPPLFVNEMNIEQKDFEETPLDTLVKSTNLKGRTKESNDLQLTNSTLPTKVKTKKKTRFKEPFEDDLRNGRAFKEKKQINKKTPKGNESFFEPTSSEKIKSFPKLI